MLVRRTRVRLRLWKSNYWPRNTCRQRQSKAKTGRVADSNILIPQCSAPIRTFPQSHYRRGLKRVAITPPIMKPRPFLVGVFSHLLATIPAYLRGFPPAGFAGRPSDPSFDTFFSRAALPIKRPKSAKAARDPITDQPVTRGRFKRFDCVIGLARGNDRLWHFTTHLRYVGYY